MNMLDQMFIICFTSYALLVRTFFLSSKLQFDDIKFSRGFHSTVLPPCFQFHCILLESSDQ